MDKITWKNETRKLSELKPWERNPRQINKDQAKRLAESFETFGQVETIAVGPDNQVYNGHQRLSVLMDKYGASYEVEVRVSSRELIEKEREKLTVFLHKGAAGEWDFDTLSEWDTDDLLLWGFGPFELGLNEEGSIDLYTNKIVSPQYEPSEESPEIIDLFDTTKTKNLIENINNSEGITDEEREFLICAAKRHVVFNFKRIADYYANANSTMQKLMEENALVIIDYKDAIKQGYIDLVEEIDDMRRGDYGDE